MARQLIVLRHAKSDYPIGVADKDRPLSARGERDAHIAGTWLRDCGFITADTVALVSSATRTQQTWALAGAHLPNVQLVVEPKLYSAGVDDVVALLDEVEADTIVVVGHNPTMHSLVTELVGSDPHGLLDSIRWKYPTCTIAALRNLESGAFGYGSSELLALTTPRG